MDELSAPRLDRELSERCTLYVHDSREAWLERRRQYLCGSDAATLLGLNPWRSALELYADKVGLGKELVPNEAMEWGHLMESPIKSHFTDMTGLSLAGVGNFDLYVSKDYQPCRLAASPDDIVYKPGAGFGIFEAKTTSAWKRAEWETGVPAHYAAQVQHYMMVLGLGYAYVAVLIGGQEFRIEEIERDDYICAQIREAAEAFWRRVDNQDPPSPDESKGAKDALARVYPKDSGREVELDASCVALDERREELSRGITLANRDLKKLQEEKRGIDNTLKGHLATAAVGVLENGVKYTWKTIQKKGYTIEPGSSRQLRRIRPANVQH